MCFLILGAYLQHELVESDDHYSLWYAYGYPTLIIPFLMVVAIFLMLRSTKQRWDEIMYYRRTGKDPYRK
jgi:hypothetical protein